MFGSGFGSGFGSVRSALEGLAAGFDAAGLSGDEAVAAVRDLGVIARLAEALAGKAAVQVDETAAYRRYGDRSAADTVAKAFGIGGFEARRLRETAERLSAFAGVDAQVRAGRLSSRDAALIVGVLGVAPEAQGRLLSAARQGHRVLREECVRVRAAKEDAAERVRRQHRDRSFRTWSDADGMVAGSFRLTPEVGAPIVAWFDAAVQRVFQARRAGDAHESHEAYAADVFAALVHAHMPPAARNAHEHRPEAGAEPGAAECGGSAAPVPVEEVVVDTGGGRTVRVRRGVDVRVHVLVDHAVLAQGEAREGDRCEIPGVGPVSYQWVRSLLGDAFLTAVVKKGVDITTVAHLGRHIPAELRTALVVSGRECDVEGCEVSGYLEVDHDHEYARGGPTAWWNLGWLCARHHKQKTSGWTLGPRDPATRKRALIPPDQTRRRRPHAA